MPLDILSVPPAALARLAPVEPRFAPLFGVALLTVACVLASFAFACATPFAAFAVVAAAMLPSRPALLVVTGTWLVNQAIGFGWLGYPLDTDTMLWGIVIGMAALAATATAMLALRALPRTASLAALAVAWLAAFAAYQIVLFAATPMLGGAADFTPAIVGRLGALSLFWLAGLVAACEVVRLLSLVRRRQIMS